MQIVPGQRVGGDSATKMLALDEASLQTMSDPWERARQANLLAEALRQVSAAVLNVRRQAVRELVVQQGVPQTRVARHLGVSSTRICQIVGPRVAAASEGVPA